MSQENILLILLILGSTASFALMVFALGSSIRRNRKWAEEDAAMLKEFLARMNQGKAVKQP
jgi:hypothetical protein